MKRKICLSVLIFSFTFLFAANDFKFSAEPIFTLKAGELGEHLYANLDNVQHPKTSQLDWQEKPVLIYGIKGSVSWKNIFLEGQFSYGIPMKCGQMTDRDWFCHTDICQSLSVSPLELRESIDGNVKLGYQLEMNSICSISPFVGYTYEYFDFYAAPGSGKMDPDPGWKNCKDTDGEILQWDSEKTEPFNTCEISLWRIEYFIWAGFDFNFYITDSLSAAAYFSFAPYAKASSEDYHPNKALKYLQDLNEGYLCALKTGLNVAWKINSKFSLAGYFDYMYLEEIYGTTYESSETGLLGFPSDSDYCAASHYDFSFTLGARIRIF